MPKIQEVVGFLTEALEMDACEVQARTAKLLSSGRLDGNEASPSACADLLCVLLNTDQDDFSAAYDLPLVGMLVLPSDRATDLHKGTFYDGNSSGMAGIGKTLGQFLANHIEELLPGQPLPLSFDSVEVSGRGETLRALIKTRLRQGEELGWIWFGRQTVSEIISARPYNVVSLQRCHVAAGPLLGMLARLLVGKFPTLLIPMRESRSKAALH